MWEYVRRARPSFQAFVGLIRRQTPGYTNLDDIVGIAAAGIGVSSIKPLPAQTRFRRNHPSASTRSNISKNIRKEQDLFRCLVSEANLIDIWPEIHTSQLGKERRSTDRWVRESRLAVLRK
ncbi:hypothetical protein PHMEG_00023309 [Phytophthora megakarya]|uniref:Uncharacterized protein n=1 Tax=Phytophthora megakarya TaxID=4795 RepID=A0A225VHE3_9STRA|nr:hypothetical protein PHMEG_00023309 [Phytophthora megakarya]